MPRPYPPELRRQVIELARSGTRVALLAETFGMSAVSIYKWLKQDRIDRGEVVGETTDQQLELAAAKQRIKQLETELAVARKVNEVLLKEGVHRLVLRAGGPREAARHRLSPPGAGSPGEGAR